MDRQAPHQKTEDIGAVYDEAFAFLATATQHEKLKSKTSTYYYIEAAFAFLEASKQEKTEKSRELVKRKVAKFICRVDSIHKNSSALKMPIRDNPMKPDSACKFDLETASFYFALAIGCEENSRENELQQEYCVARYVTCNFFFFFCIVLLTFVYVF